MVSRIKIHRDGPEFSRMVWGAFRIADNPETSGIASIARTVDTCLDAGITTIDHADIYGSYRVEALFGEMLATRPDLRNRIELVTKCGIALTGPARPEHRVKHYNSTAAHIRWSLENSLRNLKTDHVDLLLLHRPDPLMDAAEVAEVLEALVAEGKTRAVGVSNYTPSQFAMLQSKLPIPLMANQTASDRQDRQRLPGCPDRAATVRLVALDIDAQGGARRAGARQAEDDTRAAFEQHTDALVLADRAVDRVV
jgi:predicted oxidoreductase